MPLPPLLQRLKERKLVQWALAYAAGAWVVVESLDLVLERFRGPEIIGQSVIVVAFFGFLLTLILAWYHGEKGRQRVSGPELLMVAAVLVVAGAVLSVLPQGREGGAVPVTPSDGDRPSIAVLPLENHSPDPADAYFADGMQEQLGTVLAGIKGLIVRGRMSATRYRAEPKPLPEVARELGVQFVIEGSVRMAGSQVTVSVKLVDAVRDESLGAYEFDREFSVEEIVSIHREIAERVVAEVQAVLTPEEETQLATGPTTNTEAYEEYLKGRFHWSTRSAQGLDRAVEHFKRAISLDPSFALAHSGLADCYAVLTYFSANVEPAEMFQEGERAALEAIRLKPDLAAAHASLGFLTLLGRRDWSRAEASLRHAIALDPTYAPAHHWLANLLSYTGRFEESNLEGQRAIDLDPLDFSHTYSHAGLLLLSRDFEAAVAQYERTVDLYPLYFLGWAGLAEALLMTGDIEGALRARSRSDELFGIDPALSERHLRMISDFHRTGIPGRLPEAFDTVSGFPPSWRATSAMWVGDTAKALAWLERAAAENWPDLLGIRWSPLYDPIRDQPRFQALMERYLDAGR